MLLPQMVWIAERCLLLERGPMPLRRVMVTDPKLPWRWRNEDHDRVREYVRQHA
jgi:hypothetical protein